MPKMYIGSRQVSQAVNLARQVDDRNLVHLTDDETINGTKTFTTHPVIKTTEADARILTQFDDLTIGETPSVNHFAGFLTRDKDDTQFANCNCSYRTDGSIGSNFYVERRIDDTTVSGYLGIYISQTGSLYTIAPTPDSDDNSTKIATTEWVNDRTNIRTNCITEIPQDIKLELNDGTLTLKSGSKVYIPNGFEQDGVTRKFDVLTIDTDIIRTEDTNHEYFTFYKNNIIYIGGTDVTTSGTTQPTVSGTYAYWYDLTNNVIKRTDDGGSTWTSGYSLPYGLISVSDASIKSIDQVFQGIGFIGNYIFVLPGVKGLMSNGRNENGTIKNRAIQYTQVALRDTGSGIAGHGGTGTATSKFNNASPGIAWDGGSFGYVYDFANNYYYTTDPSALSFEDSKRIKLAEFAHNGSRITLLTPNYVFQAVDYNDFKNYKNEVNDSIANISTTLDSTVVHLTGDETITGSKTFTSNLILQNSSYSLFDNYPSSIYYDFTDKNNKTTGWLENRINGNSNTGNPGQSTIKIFAKTYTDDTYTTAVNNSIELHVFPDGTGYATCPTPPANDNSTKIATTAWVNSAKTTIVGWGVPDKSRAISVAKKSSGSSYTAQVTGWVQIIGGSGGNRLATLDCYNSTNGYGDTDHVGEYADQYGTIRCMLLVSAGDTYTVTYWNASLTSITEIPLKGA